VYTVASQGGSGGGTAMGDTSRGDNRRKKNFVGQLNEARQVKKVTPHPGGGDTRVKAIKSDSDSDSDKQKMVARFFRKK